MNETKRKGLTKTEVIMIVALVIVIAILLALLVPALGNISKMGKQFKSYQDETNQQLADLKDKIENCDCLTAEQLQAKIAEEIKKYNDAHPGGITDDQIAAIVDAVLAKVPAGLTQAQVKKLINDALKGIDTLTEEEVKKLIADALAGKADTRTVEEKLQAGETVKLDDDYTMTKWFGVSANATLDLGGNTLVMDPEFYGLDILGNVTIKNGNIVTYRTGQLNVAPGGNLTLTNVTFTQKDGLASSLTSKGTTTIDGCSFINANPYSNDMVSNGITGDGVKYPGNMTIKDTTFAGTYKTNYTLIHNNCGTLKFAGAVSVTAIRPVEAEGGVPYYGIIESDDVISGTVTINGKVINY